MSTLLVLCRFVHFAAVLLLFGAWVFRPLLLGREPFAALDRNLTRLGRWLAGIALATGVCWLLLITASMAGSGAAALDPATLQLVLGKTFFGQVWSWHLLLNGALVVLLLTRLGERLALRLILAALLLVCGMFALALFNRLRIEDCQQRLGTLRRSVLLEWLLGIAAVAAVSLLGTLPPLTA